MATKNKLQKNIKETPKNVQFWAGVVLIIISMLVMLIWRWEKWGAFIIDSGRELYVPWRILSGDILYKDLSWFNGPLSPYVNAFLLVVFGIGIKTLVLSNFVFLLLFTIFLYHFLYKKLNTLIALFISLIFITSFSLPQLLYYDLFNFLLPYSYCAVYGFYLAFLSVLFSSIGFTKKKSNYFLLGSFFLGLTYLTKPELFLAALITCLTFIGFAVYYKKEKRFTIKVLTLSFFAFIFPVLVVFLVFYISSTPDAAFKAAAGGWLHAFNSKLTNLYFYKSKMGILNPIKSIGTILLVSLVYGGIFGFIAFFSLSKKLLRLSRLKRQIVLFVIIGLASALLWNINPFFKALRPLPFILIFILVKRIYSWIKTKDNEICEEIGWVLFSLILLVKIFLNVNFYDYGFYLAFPGTAILILILLKYLPEIIKKRGGDPVVFKTGMVFILLALTSYHLYLTGFYLSQKDTRFGYGPDALMIEKGEAFVAEQLEEFIDKNLKENEPFLVIPEGVMLNYLFRRPCPIPFYNFMPPELIMFGEENIINALKEKRPRFVILLPKYMPEYGVEAFGVGYAEKLQKWIKNNYGIIQKIQDPEMRKDYIIPFHFGYILVDRKIIGK